MRLSLSLILAAAPAFAASPDAPIRTLGEAYAAALAASEQVAVSEQAIRRAEALYKEALGSSLPELSYRSQTSVQDGTRGRAETDGALRLSHAGLNGYRELAAVRAAKADAGAERFRRRRAEQLLLSDLAGAYYGLLQAREDATNIAELQKLAELRLKELQERVRVGRSREADAIAQEFQASSLKAQFEESSRLAGARADLLAYLTRSSVVEAAAPASSAPAADLGLPHYLARVEDRPDVGAARLSAESAGQSVKAAQGDRLPELALGLNRYTNRPVVRERVKWDAGLTLSFPLFSWGAGRAAVEQARTSAETGTLDLSAARRQAELEVRNAYRDLASARRQLEVRRHAVELAERDYALQRRDEARGLVTSLEILESLNRLSAARLARSAADLTARLAAVSLELAAGARPEALDLK
ncbi:TolC family protein [bacterium]|nr:MAG: TolC family protein [bacterium]